MCRTLHIGSTPYSSRCSPKTAITSATGGRAPPRRGLPTSAPSVMEPPAFSRRPGDIRAGLLQNLVGLPELAKLALEVLDPCAHAARHTGAPAGVDLGLPNPASQRLGRAAEFARNRHQRRPPRSTTARALTNQTHRPLANLVRKHPAHPLLLHADPFLTRRSLRETPGRFTPPSRRRSRPGAATAPPSEVAAPAAPPPSTAAISTPPSAQTSRLGCLEEPRGGGRAPPAKPRCRSRHAS